jgi:ADP-ribose pyrophosphatase
VSAALEGRVLERSEARISEWVTLVTRSVLLPGAAGPQTYHSLVQADYITVLAVLPDGRIPLVRQYRPVLERVTLELPGGIIDTPEPPAAAMAREITEETGYEPAGELQLLGTYSPNMGRLENRLWCYFTALRAERVAGWRPECGIETVLVCAAELRAAILDGRFMSALQIGAIGLAEMQGLFAWR